ncbi:MAG: O-antigen ligase family protein [bacterium]
MEKKFIFIAVILCIGLAWLVFNKNQIRALLIAICFSYVLPVGWIFYHYTGIYVVDVPLIAIFVIALAQGRKVKFYIKGVSLPILLFILWMFVTGSMGMHFGWSLAETSKWIRAYLLFLALVNFASKPKDFKAALWGLLAGFALEVFIGVYQWRIGTVGLWFLGERLFRAEWWRAHGTFYVPSFFGNYLIMLFPFIIRLFLFYRPPDKRETYVFATLTVFGLAALYATYARGPWISFIAANALLFLYSLFKSHLRPKLKWPIALSILMGIAFTIKYLPVIEAQFGEDREQAAMSRIYLGEVALRLIDDNMLFGAGPGCYELLSPRYVIPIEEYPTEHLSERVHNTYLLILSENGIAGGILFLLILIVFFRIGARLLKSKSILLANIGTGWIACIMSIAISFVASPDIQSEQILAQFFLLAGFTQAGNEIEKQMQRRGRFTKFKASSKAPTHLNTHPVIEVKNS